MAYRHDGFFFAMDTFREYQSLNELWTVRQSSVAGWGMTVSGKIGPFWSPGPPAL